MHFYLVRYNLFIICKLITNKKEKNEKYIECQNFLVLLVAHTIHLFNRWFFILFAFLAELFRGMLFKWKGANKKSHQKWGFIVNLVLWLVK